ncbi:hypothetical protein [Bacillus sp. FJAT-47783]|uniref:hypothetical protein n=1 Tax=Bacillus sp. FJAT-47783 TaxID=2922712 RepID=UPI001FAE4ED0|nr:hypothetical protein [Bacillus sp. FJAT-47783]
MIWLYLNATVKLVDHEGFRAEDQFGGKQRSDVWSFLTKEGVVHPPELENPDRPDNGDSGGSENETDDKHSNNNGDQSGHDNVDNHDQNGNSPFENETNKPIENVSNDKSSTFNKHENLPNTATTMYNWLLLGISLLLLGVIAQKMTGRKHLYK